MCVYVVCYVEHACIYVWGCKKGAVNGFVIGVPFIVQMHEGLRVFILIMLSTGSLREFDEKCD